VRQRFVHARDELGFVKRDVFMLHLGSDLLGWLPAVFPSDE
jgi:hypothetical protein